MEKRFRVWTCREGEQPLFHTGPTNDIYSIEGQIIDELDSGKSPFSANNPDEALAFLVPSSISSIMHFWSRGADHFMISCHDWVCLFFFLLLFIFCENQNRTIRIMLRTCEELDRGQKVWVVVVILITISANPLIVWLWAAGTYISISIDSF